jgi:hypothetical protein
MGNDKVAIAILFTSGAVSTGLIQKAQFKQLHDFWHIHCNNAAMVYPLAWEMDGEAVVTYLKPSHVTSITVEEYDWETDYKRGLN